MTYTQKDIGHGRDSNPRPSVWKTSKILINLYAQLTLVFQLVEKTYEVLLK